MGHIRCTQQLTKRDVQIRRADWNIQEQHNGEATRADIHRGSNDRTDITRRLYHHHSGNLKLLFVFLTWFDIL